MNNLLVANLVANEAGDFVPISEAEALYKDAIAREARGEYVSTFTQRKLYTAHLREQYGEKVAARYQEMVSSENYYKPTLGRPNKGSANLRPHYWGKACNYNHVNCDGLTKRYVSSRSCVACEKVRNGNRVHKNRRKNHVF